MIALDLPFGLFAHHAASQPVPQVSRVGDWKVKVVKDAFAGATTCTAIGPHMRLQGAVVVLSLGRSQDTSDAVYRIDGAAPRRPVKNSTAAIQSLFIADRGDLSNPSGGLVALPIDELIGAQRVDVRATPRNQVRSFNVSTLREVLKTERRSDCPAPPGWDPIPLKN